MAYDEAFAERIRAELAHRAPDLREQKMFGGIGFMLNGNMCVGILGDRLIARVPVEDTPALLERPGVAPFAPTGRPMKGWLFVDREAVRTRPTLRTWVRRSIAFVDTLAPK